MKKLIFIVIAAALTVYACKKEKEPEPAPVACFSFPNVPFAIGDTVAFTNCSENAETYTWDFGDGSTSTVKSPSHTYTTAGTYTVKLTAKSSDGTTKDDSKSITLSGPGFAIFYQEQNGGAYEYIDVTVNTHPGNVYVAYRLINDSMVTIPNCGAAGCANFTLTPGVKYNYTAQVQQTGGGGKAWYDTMSVQQGQCLKIKLDD